MSSGATSTMCKGQQWLPFAFLSGVFLLWLPALAGPFQFDDYNVIVDFAPVHSLAAWWHSLPGIRPLLKLSYTLNWMLSPEPFGFHLANLLIHLLNGVLLLLWARRVLPLQVGAQLALMVLWLLHPVQTEAVTYIAGRSVSLSTTFLLTGLFALARLGPRGPTVAALCTLLALAVRETAWIFPLVFLLVEHLRGRSLAEALRAAVPSAVMVMLAAAGFLLEPHYRHLIDTSFSLRDSNAQLRAQVVGIAYLLQQIFTLSPNIDPDLRVPLHWNPWLLLQGAVLLVLLLASAWGTLRHRSWPAGGLLWLLLLLLPTNSFMPRLDIASERHLYPALIGPTWSLLMMLENLRFRTFALVLLALLLATATAIRNEDYRSELALWARTSEQSPGKSRMWRNLGQACRAAGNLECAREAYRRAVALDPVDSRAGASLYLVEKQLAAQK